MQNGTQQNVFGKTEDHFSIIFCIQEYRYKPIFLKFVIMNNTTAGLLKIYGPILACLKGFKGKSSTFYMHVCFKTDVIME